MKNSSEIYRSLIDESLYCLDQGTQYLFLNSAIRSLLQTACICALEHGYAVLDDLEQTALPQLAMDIRSPSDGLFPRLLTTVLPLIRQAGWSSCCTPWFQPTSEISSPLLHRVELWVKHRNDHPGHGVVAENTMVDAMTWLPLLARDLATGLADLLPAVDGKGILTILPPDVESPRKIVTLRFHDNSPVVIRSMVMKGASWRVSYQTLDLRNSKNSFFEIEDSAPLFMLTRCETHRYRTCCVEIGGESIQWKPLVSLPTKQTTAFSGRTSELEALREWLDDVDSRVCNVYGEGGIGKTTLVLELLNGILGDEIPVPSWRPEIIAFYSAKETRWGPDGLQQLKGATLEVEEAAREIARVFEERLDKSWYEGSGKSIIDKATTLMASAGCGRDSILLVLDNAETLTKKQTDEDELGRLISYLGKRLCRVLVTSRRRERMEARPVQVPALDDETGEALLRKLGAEYGANQLISAGGSTLRRINKQFTGRPILLDVFARLVGRYGYSIDHGIESVHGMAGGDLGEFLYQDAWNRTDARTREALLVLGQLGSSVTEEVLSWTCSETLVTQESLFAALEETRFGNVYDYGQRLELNFDTSARTFLGEKFHKLDKNGEAHKRVERAAGNVRKRNEQYLRVQHVGVIDRVARAFQCEAAKAAHRAYRQGDYQQAETWFEEAIRVDRGNAALLDRFARFLALKRQDTKRGAMIAKMACDADPRDADAHFTAGLISARMGDVSSTDRFMNLAKGLGKPEHSCILQRAWARCNSLKELIKSKSRDLDVIDKLIESARHLASQAKIANPETPNDAKHNEERKILLSRLDDHFDRAYRLRTYNLGTHPRV